MATDKLARQADTAETPPSKRYVTSANSAGPLSRYNPSLALDPANPSPLCSCCAIAISVVAGGYAIGKLPPMNDGWSHENLAPAVAIHADRDQHRQAGDRARLAGRLVSGAGCK